MPEIDATITKVIREEGSEWGEIHTDHGTVKRLTTKMEAKIAEAGRFRRSGERVSISYTQRDRTVDTESGPRTFHNYYFEGAKPVSNGSWPAADDGIDTVPRAGATSGATAPRKTDPDDAWRMCLNKGGELAVSTLPLMPVEQRDFETQKTIAVAWAEFFFFHPRPSTPSRSLVPEQQAVQTGPGAYYEPDAVPQDDIPY